MLTWLAFLPAGLRLDLMSKEWITASSCLYKRANVAILEKPNPSDQGQGWVRNDGGVLEPLWSHEPVLPVSLVDILDSINQEEGDEEESEQEELVDIEIFEESDEEWWTHVSKEQLPSQ